jgi:hypothetical protein
MPMPACATAERAVFSCRDQNKETNRRKQRQRRGFQDSTNLRFLYYRSPVEINR